MSSEDAGPFLEDHRDTVIGLCTIEQRLNAGGYVDLAGHATAEMLLETFWSDIDECLDVCESIGRCPASTRNMRALAARLCVDFWNFRLGYESRLKTMNPVWRSADAVTFVAGDTVVNCVGNVLDGAVQGYAAITQWLTDTLFTGNGSPGSGSLDSQRN